MIRRGIEAFRDQPLRHAPVAARSELLRTLRAEFETAVPSPKGPVSNTGLNPHSDKPPEPFALSLDYVTLVFSQGSATKYGQHTRTIVGWLFGTTGMTTTPLKAKMWQFYKSSAYIHDAEGNTVGRIGCDGNGDTWCVSLTGAGCKLVRSWDYTFLQAETLGAHLSRIDIAFDDFHASVFEDIHKVDSLARGGFFACEGKGRPPRTHFIDDHGSNNGCTVYVGSKGRKELCVYEKGKQLGDPSSPWIRCELRLWRSNGEIPLNAMLRPQQFLIGAYDILADRIPHVGEGLRPETTKREVAAHAVAVTRYLHEQCGPMLFVMWEALGSNAAEWFKDNVFRNTLPARFKGVAGNRESLLTILRDQLGYSLDPPF
jgi:phage replication initiation protein